MKVRFCSPVKSHMGYAQFGRILVNQLVHARVDVTVFEIPLKAVELDYGTLGSQVEQLTGELESADVNIINMLPTMFERFRLPGARNIGCTMFEADRLPATWVAHCNAMDAIWVPSQWGRQSFIDSGVTVPVFVVGVDAAPTPVAEPRPGPFRLLSVFQWSVRKNPAALLRAYCAAFDGQTDCVLTLKTHRHADPQQNHAFVKNAVDYTLSRIHPARSLPRVEIATDLVSTRQVDQLHAESHAYVSLSHGEGWSLPAWEATLAGKPVIHTGWSAPTEFVHEQGLVRCNLAPVFGMDDIAPFYDTSMSWADAHLDDAIAKLRDLRGNYERWLRNARSQRDVMNNRYSMDRRVEQLKAALRPAD